MSVGGRIDSVCIDVYNIQRSAMSPKELAAFRIDVDLLEAMRQVKDTDGIPVTTQIEKAVADWLKRRGVVVKRKTERKRPAGRKRS